MSNDWDLNGEDTFTEKETSDAVQEERHPETESHQPEQVGEEQNGNEDENAGAENIEAEAAPKPAEEESCRETESSQTENNGTYHWVNPDYQKRQQGTADASQNTYEAEHYRENVGYQGGGYHSDWRERNQSGNPNASSNGSQEQNPFPGGPETGQRRYGSYQFPPESQNPESKRKQPRQKRPMGIGKKFLVTAGMAVVFGVVAGGVMFGVNTLGNALTGQGGGAKPQVQVSGTELPAAEKQANSSGNTAGGYAVADVASSCMPSVVSITNASVETVKDFFGGVQQRPIESTGSGIIVGQNDTELLIATNNHVVDKAESLTVAFSDETVCEAQTKGTDADNDLAVIAVKLEDMTAETLQAVKIISLGDSDSLRIGEQVVAIGNALGYGQSVTSGWVSAVNRQVTDQYGNSSKNLIQTDAAINPGNSGGALLNMKGELIGINVAKTLATEVEGMGYAIPVSKAQPILDELMNRQTRYKASEKKAAYMGVVCLTVETGAAQMYGIPEGAFVDSVEEGGPSEKAGIQKGDVIVKFDGLTIQSGNELVSTLEYYEAGETVEVVISRAEGGEYKEQTLQITLGKRSEMKQSVPEQ